MLTLWCRHADFLTHLEQEISFFKAMALHERNRAEVAIAELLAFKVGTSALHPSLVRAATENPRAVEDLLQNPEFTSAGAAE